MTNPIHTFLFPRESARAMAVTGILAGVAGLLTVILGVYVFKDYGIALFCGTPIAMGVAAPLFYGVGAPRTYFQLLGAAILAQCFLFAGMLVFGIEGIVCVIMALPLWMTCAIVGASIAYPIHHSMWKHMPQFGPRDFPVIGFFFLAMVPLFMGAEHAASLKPPMLAVTSSVEIDAPPEVVWKHVIVFPELSPPTEWLFRLGVAYPIHAVIDGHGPGAVRRCEFSTGAFVEPITVWDEDRLLAFNVTQSPPSMQEFNPFWDIHPPHLDGYLNSRHGQFKLIDLGHGRTRLEGTTWYENNMFPAAYWRLWSDAIIHQIHLRVLNHVKALSERKPAEEILP